jgi:very-short-patch-repair endonuclease
MIRVRLSSGALIRCHQGIYAAGHLAEIEFAPEAAVLLACGPHASLAARSGCVVWKLAAPDPSEPIHVSLPEAAPGAYSLQRNPRIVVHRSRTLAKQDVTIHRGLPVTSPARTLLDCAETLTPRALERALDEALALRIVSISKLRDVLSRAHGRQGAPLLKRLLDHRGPSTITRSQAEERMLELIRLAGLPAPEMNVTIGGGFTVDFLWRRERVAVEVDGYAWHHTKSAFERDRRKDAFLKQTGIDLARVTWDQMSDEPLAIIARLATTIALRMAV